MNPYELTEDIIKVDRKLHITHGFETSLALQRLLEVLKAWRVTARKKGK